MSPPVGAARAVERRRGRSLGFSRCRSAADAGQREAAWQELAAIQREILASNPVDQGELGEVLLRCGVCLQRMERFIDAEGAYTSALAAAHRANDLVLIARISSQTGNFLATRERFAEAATLMAQAVELGPRLAVRCPNIVRRAPDRPSRQY